MFMTKIIYQQWLLFLEENWHYVSMCTKWTNLNGTIYLIIVYHRVKFASASAYKATLKTVSILRHHRESWSHIASEAPQWGPSVEIGFHVRFFRGTCHPKPITRWHVVPFINRKYISFMFETDLDVGYFSGRAARMPTKKKLQVIAAIHTIQKHSPCKKKLTFLPLKLLRYLHNCSSASEVIRV